MSVKSKISVLKCRARSPNRAGFVTMMERLCWRRLMVLVRKII